MTPVDSSPFAIFSFLVAPAILTNASTLLALGTSNRLARSVDRSRAIAATLMADASGGKGPSPALTRDLAQEQFLDASHRCRVLIRALRSFYLAIGCFAAGTCVAMIGATLGYFEYLASAHTLMIAMLVMAAVGVVAIVLGSVFLVGETTLTLGLLKAEQVAIHKALGDAVPRPPA